MEDDEQVENTSLADRPGLVLSLAVIRIQGEDGEDVGGREENGYLRPQGKVEEGLIDAEGRAEAALFDWGWKRLGERRRDWLEGRRPGEVDLGASHDAWVCMICLGVHARAFDGGMLSLRRARVPYLVRSTPGVVAMVD